MKKKLKTFKFIRILFFITYLILSSIFYFAVFLNIFGQEVLDYAFFKFMLLLISFTLLIYAFNSILTFFSIIWHELGHLTFGLISKMKFVSFSVLNYVIEFEHDKLKLKKWPRIPGVAGYCNLTTEVNKNYNSKTIKYYFLGGIIFNFISVIISMLLAFIIQNTYIDYICMLNIVMNAYMALNNSIPTITKSGINTDMLHLLCYLEDDNYIGTMSKFNYLQKMLVKYGDIDKIDTSLFVKPEKFKTTTDILNAMFYVDFLSSNEKYKEAIDYAKKILDEGKDIITKNNVIILKMQLINCIFNSGEDLNEIKEIWDDDLKTYFNVMEKIMPISIGFNYIYASLIEKNEEDSKKYLTKFEKLKRSNYDKNQLKELEMLMKDIQKRIEKEKTAE